MPSKSARRFAVLAATAAVAGSAVLFGAAPPPLALAAAGDPISGVVFNDYNHNGAQDTSTSPGGVTDGGVAGVTVTAYAADGSIAGSATTAATGAYSLTATKAGPWRVEFTGLPANYQSGPHGPDSGTTTQFVADGPATSVSAGVLIPDHFCQDNPLLATTCFVDGLYTGAVASDDTVVAYPYGASGLTGTYAPPYAVPGSPTYGVPSGGPRTGDGPAASHLAFASETGSVWGTTWLRDTSSLLTAAMVKRHSDLGPLGTGGIYATDYSNPGAPTTAAWLDVSTLVYPATVLGGAAVTTGPDPRDGSPGNAPLPAVPGTPSHDVNAFDAVGRAGVGDIEVSADGTTLYAVNLFDKTVLAIDVATKSLVAAWEVPNPGCTDSGFNGNAPADDGDNNPADDHHPWGLGVDSAGDVYVGVVCSGAASRTNYPGAGPGTSNADLTANVYRVAGAVLAPVFSASLDYPRQILGGDVPGFTWGPQHWWGWEVEGGGQQTNSATQPQPILSDIQFDVDGSMILGVMDRFGHMSGNFNYRADIMDSELVDHRAGGDILRACSDGAGGWILESNARCGGAGSGVQNNASGPGGSEFYFADEYLYENPGQKGHRETTLGALALLPGSNTVATQAYDTDETYSQGTVWFDNTTGDHTHRYEIIRPGFGQGFGKVAGLGDMELLCELAPIEIGNFVWLDLDMDGVQDPGETPIGAVTLELYKDGVLVGTTTTGPNGEYYFNDSNVPGGIIPGMDYEIRIPANQPALIEYGITSNDSGSDTHDSDATDSGAGYYVIPVPGSSIPAAGHNNHTFDAGFIPAPEGDPSWDILKEVWNPRSGAWIDADADAGSLGSNDPAPAFVGHGDAAKYRVTVFNTGTVDLTGITVADPWCDLNETGVALAAGTSDSWICFHKNVTLADRGHINTATATGATDPTGAKLPDLAEKAKITVPKAALRVTKKAPAKAKAGNWIGYTITVRNRSTKTAARNVTVTDVLPVGLTLGPVKITNAKKRFVRAKGVSNRRLKIQANGSVTWKLGTIKPGKKKVIRLRVRVGTGARGGLTNKVTARGVNTSRVNGKARTVVIPNRDVVLPAVTG